MGVAISPDDRLLTGDEGRWEPLDSLEKINFDKQFIV